MKTLTIFAFFIAAALCAPAQAAVLAGDVTNVDLDTGEKLDVATSFLDPFFDEDSIVVEYVADQNGDFVGSFDFQANGPFNLILDDFQVLVAGTATKTWSLYALRDTSLVGSASYVEGRIGFPPAACPAGFPADALFCRRFGAAGSGDGAAEPGTTLFSSLTAGTYEFMFVAGSDNPAVASFELKLRPVPLPAAGLLFGTALIGAALTKRRLATRTSA